MAETTADVRRDIELTRERMSDTLAQLERKLNLMQIVKDHPWPALAVAFGAGVLLSGSGADVKAAAATTAATRGASGRLGMVLDDVVANVMTGVTAAFHGRIESLVGELKEAIGAPPGSAGGGATARGGMRAQGSGDGDDTFQGGPLADRTGLGNAGGAAGGPGAWAPQS